MAIQQDNLLILVRMTLGQNHLELELPDWDEIYKLSREQGVCGFIAQAAIFCGATNTPAWKRAYYIQINHYSSILVGQDRLHRILTEAEMEYVILKGCAAATYYPDGAYRSMGDVDLLVHSQDYDRAYDILVSNGFEQLDSIEKSIFLNGRHVELKHNGEIYELHRMFVTHDGLPARSMGYADVEQLTQNFNMLIDEKIGASVLDFIRLGTYEYHFNRLDDMTNGLILLQHINQHIRTGLGLRQIIDWMLFVKCNSSAEWWSEFEELLQFFHLEKLAHYTTAFCQIYLGLEDVVTVKDREYDVCSQMLDKIMADGNFGQNNNTDSRKMVNTINGKINAVAFFRRLQYGGLSRWDAAQKHVILRPFAWIYQLCRILQSIFTKGCSVVNFRNDLEQSNKEREFFEKLGVL